MDVWQTGQELHRRLREATWERNDGTAGDLLFTDVHHGAAPAEAARGLSNVPFAVLRHKGYTCDPDEPALVSATWEVIVVVDHEGDPRGSMGAVGGLRPSDGIAADLSSRGRGAREFIARLQQVLRSLGPSDGVELIQFSAGAGDDVDVQGRRVVSSSMTVTAHMHNVATYPQPMRDIVWGGVLTWTNPPQRFDADTAWVRGWPGTRPAGPAPTDGAAVPLVTANTCSTAGYSQFAVFSRYDPFENGSQYVFSDPLLVG